MRPLGLSQQDYDELENSRRAADEGFHPLVLTWFEKCMFVVFCAGYAVSFFFFVVSALLCRIVKGKWSV